MDNTLNDLISHGATIITPTRRLKHHLRYQYATKQLARGKRAWETPDCVDWKDWCIRSFESLSFRTQDKVGVLNDLQQQWLWQEIISHSKYKEQLLQITATAKKAIQAYELCQQWCVPIFPKDMFISESILDAFAFKQWAGNYEKQKQDNAWIDDAVLPDYITAHVAELKNKIKKIVFYDFDQLTTQQNKLKQALIDNGIDVEEHNATSRNESVAIHEETDKQTEIWSAACWAKQHLQSIVENNKNETIGIIAPNLSSLREQVEYGFASVLTPHKWLKSSEPQHKPYSISLGKPLSSYPLIYTAMNLLALGKRKFSINIMGALLHSSFISGASEEAAARAKFDAVLRRIGEQSLSFKTLYWIAEERCKEHEQCEGFIQLLKTYEISYLSHPKKQTLRDWTMSFSEWLNGFGWPGERKLNSDEHQTLQAWQSALTQLASLDGLTEGINFSTALFQLNRLLAETQFQPETTETPIQILDVTAAAGMQFDYLWVMDMQDDNWPQLKQPNAFIPVACQRDFNIPDASAEAQLKLARHITQKLTASAKEVVFSYAKQEGDRLCRPSPLINFAISNNNDLQSCVDYKDTLLASSELETFYDVHAPEIPGGQLTSGGSALFKDQSGCPFKAFARHRLYADSLQHSDIGLSAAERGNLVHRALQYLWQRLKSSDNQEYRSETELTKIIRSVVQEAIKLQISQQPETFTDRFTALEQQRLEQLLHEWLSVEKDRSGFKVIATEDWQRIVFQDIELNLRVDRIDELADGRCVIIDYKTGAVSKNDWESDRPNDPQLPLYAITNDQEVAAIAFASLKRGKLGFVGQAEADDILPGIKADAELLWQDKLDTWKDILIKLANDFRKGNAIVEPTVAACRYCDLHALCRIHGRVENPDEVNQLEDENNV